MTRPFIGTIRVPSDKSISHRALMMSAMACGTSHLSSVLDSRDVRSTCHAMEALGATLQIAHGEHGLDATVVGWGSTGPNAPSAPIDCGNSGTTARLVCGIIGGYPIEATLVGDASLSKRPMARVTGPLSRMGVKFAEANGRGASPNAAAPDDAMPSTLPLTVIGSNAPMPGRFVLPIASAQVKTAIMFCALNAEGCTDIVEPARSRDHTELMLPAFGAEAPVARDPRQVRVTGRQLLHACDLRVPADPSSAIFPAVACACTPGSSIVLEDVLLNETRIAAFRVMMRMGCDVAFERTGMAGGETVGNIHVNHADGLVSTTIGADEVPSLIDEVPILALLATCATGTMVFRGVQELRVKESDRLAMSREYLTELGCTARIAGDDLVVESGTPSRGAFLVCAGDHRMAMMGSLALRCFELEGAVDDMKCIDVSYPGFVEQMDSLQVR